MQSLHHFRQLHDGFIFINFKEIAVLQCNISFLLAVTEKNIEEFIRTQIRGADRKIEQIAFHRKTYVKLGSLPYLKSLEALRHTHFALLHNSGNTAIQKVEYEIRILFGKQDLIHRVIASEVLHEKVEHSLLIHNIPVRLDRFSFY